MKWPSISKKQIVKQHHVNFINVWLHVLQAGMISHNRSAAVHHVEGTWADLQGIMQARPINIPTSTNMQHDYRHHKHFTHACKRVISYATNRNRPHRIHRASNITMQVQPNLSNAQHATVRPRNTLENIQRTLHKHKKDDTTSTMIA